MAGPISTPPADALPADLVQVTDLVERRVTELLDHEIERWGAVDDALVAPLTALRALVLAGGKRLRPVFCHWGWVAAGGAPHAPDVIDAGGAFELLQAFALIHDDVMDGSASRRGAPAIHCQFADRHAEHRWTGESRRFGEGVAILVGDLSFVYADQLLPSSSPEVLALWHELRTEVNVGQFLDLSGSAVGGVDREGSRKIAVLKSGRYTIERPLQIGALLAGRPDLAEALAAYGDPLGEAFQLRDDVLGVFGDTARTGKPVGDDLREGKPTLLLAVAAERAGEAEAELLGRVGDPDLSTGSVAELQDLFVSSGALAVVEGRITELTDRAIGSLATIEVDASVRTGLRDLAEFVVARTT